MSLTDAELAILAEANLGLIPGPEHGFWVTSDLLLHEAIERISAARVEEAIAGRDQAHPWWLRISGSKVVRPGGCGVCTTCSPGFFGMYLCAKCGNKRCPGASDCLAWECSGSNDPDQTPVERRRIFQVTYDSMSYADIQVARMAVAADQAAMALVANPPGVILRPFTPAEQAALDTADNQQQAAACNACPDGMHDACQTVWCKCCGGGTSGPLPHECDTGWFDRSICPEPCGVMHSYCTRCGDLQDPCAHEN
jgi:hypothetical protein